MHFGVVILPELPWARAAGLWRRAEQLGFEHAWTYDHLAWRALRDRPWYGAIPTLVAAATATERLRIGTLVASPNFRHPLPFAKEMIALDDVSGGRAIAGIGAGGQGWDATMLGRPPWSAQERAERFVEFVTLTDLLLSRPELTWAGRFYAVDGARTYPGCVQQPRLPLAIAAGGPTGMGLAARYGDFWVSTGGQAPAGVEAPEGVPAPQGARVLRGQIARLADACSRVGRDPSSLRKLVLTGFRLAPGLSSPGEFAETVGHYEAAGVTDLVVHWPRADEPFAGDPATFERIFSSPAAG